MAWTVPLTWVGGQVLTAALLNTHLRDNMLETDAAKSLNQGSYCVSSGANALAERIPSVDRIDTSETTASLAYTNLATVGPTVTVTTGDRAWVMCSARMGNTALSGHSYMGPACTGATTIGAQNNKACNMGGVTAANDLAVGEVNIWTGLTPGVNTFTAKYVVTTGTGNFSNRVLIVFPL